MRRALAVILVLTTVLGGFLYIKLRKQRKEASRPSGGSATIEGWEVDVVAKLSARVKAVRVSEGDRVEKGQELVELDCREVEAIHAQAKAQVAVLEAASVVARMSASTANRQVGLAWSMTSAAKAARNAAEVEQSAASRAAVRLKKLHRAGAASDQNLDLTETRAKGLSLKVKAADSQLKAARFRTGVAAAARETAKSQYEMTLRQVDVARAAVRRAELALEECRLKAPRSGYVLVRSVEPGEMVLPGSRVLTIVDIMKVKATFYVPNAELGAVMVGKKVKVTADAYRGKQFWGVITRIGKEAEFTPRNVQTRDDRDRLVYAVEVTLSNPAGLLRPGMPVEISVPREEKAKAGKQ